MTTKETKTRSRRSYFGPILLIFVGLIFLAENLGLISGEGWSTIWKLWPVLLVVAGLDDLIRGEGIAWPLLLIGAGGFLLYNYFGPQNWISWTEIARLWPILLIAAGIDIMFRGRSGWSSLIGILLTAALIGGAAWMVSSNYQVAPEYSDISESISPDISNAEINISLGWSEIFLSETTRSDILIEGNITPTAEDAGRMERLDSKVIYRLTTDQLAFYPQSSRWELDLTDRLDLDLRVNSGAGETLLALEQLEITSLDANQGVGRMVVRLPDRVSGDILIKQAVGAIRVYIPDGSRVVVDAQNGLTVVDYPDDFELGNGFYGSPGATLNNADLNITVEQAVGVVNIQYAK